MHDSDSQHSSHLGSPSRPGQVVCPHCRGGSPSRALYCIWCGLTLHGPRGAVEGKPTSDSPAPVSPSSAQGAPPLNPALYEQRSPDGQATLQRTKPAHNISWTILAVGAVGILFVLLCLVVSAITRYFPQSTGQETSSPTPRGARSTTFSTVTAPTNAFLTPDVSSTNIGTVNPTGTSLPKLSLSTPTSTSTPAVMLKLIDKEYVASARENGYRDGMNFYFEVANNMDKDIRAFKGVVYFKDLFDEEIFSTSLTYEDGLDAGQTINWTRGMEYNSYSNSHFRLQEIELENLRTDFVLEQIVLKDGTTVSGAQLQEDPGSDQAGKLSTTLVEGPPYAEYTGKHQTMTDAQWAEYIKTLEGVQITAWSGWVHDVVRDNDATYQLQLDMDGPDEIFAAAEVIVRIPRAEATKYNKGQKVVFSGNIHHIDCAIGVCDVIVEKATVEGR